MAEKIGQVTGLLTDGLKLADNDYLQNLLQTGLDHLLFILQPDMPASWQALETYAGGSLHHRPPDCHTMECQAGRGDTG